MRFSSSSHRNVRYAWESNLSLWIIYNFTRWPSSASRVSRRRTLVANCRRTKKQQKEENRCGLVLQCVWQNLLLRIHLSNNFPRPPYTTITIGTRLQSCSRMNHVLTYTTTPSSHCDLDRSTRNHTSQHLPSCYSDTMHNHPWCNRWPCLKKSTTGHVIVTAKQSSCFSWWLYWRVNSMGYVTLD